MFLINSMLLGVCLAYGYLVAWLFNSGENFNQIWLWWSFIIFVINHLVLKGKLKIQFHQIDENQEEDDE